MLLAKEAYVRFMTLCNYINGMNDQQRQRNEAA